MRETNRDIYTEYYIGRYILCVCYSSNWHTTMFVCVICMRLMWCKQKKLYIKKYIDVQNIKTAWKQNIICFDNILIYIFSTYNTFCIVFFQRTDCFKRNDNRPMFLFYILIHAHNNITMDKILFRWGLRYKFINFNSTSQRLVFIVNRLVVINKYIYIEIIYTIVLFIILRCWMSRWMYSFYYDMEVLISCRWTHLRAVNIIRF